MNINHSKKRRTNSDISKSQTSKILLPLIQFLKKEHNLTKQDLISIYEGVEEIKVPLSIFTELSPLESLVKYLKENLGLRFNEIALKLNRDARSIWRTYHQAILKSKAVFEVKIDELFVPVSIFKNRNLSILENLAAYLKDELHVSVKEISSLTSKKPSTIWTVYNRAKKKNEQ